MPTRWILYHIATLCGSTDTKGHRVTMLLTISRSNEDLRDEIVAFDDEERLLVDFTRWTSPSLTVSRTADPSNDDSPPLAGTVTIKLLPLPLSPHVFYVLVNDRTPIDAIHSASIKRPASEYLRRSSFEQALLETTASHRVLCGRPRTHRRKLYTDG